MHLRRKLLEGLYHLFFCSVDIQMVSIHGRYDGQPGVQLQERAVVLVGLCHHQLRGRMSPIVGAVIGRYATEESRAAQFRIAEYVGRKG